MSDLSSETHSHGAAARLPSRAMEISAGADRDPAGGQHWGGQLRRQDLRRRVRMVGLCSHAERYITVNDELKLPG